MSHPHSTINYRAVAWALLSQTIWLPLVAIDLHDRWQAGIRARMPAGQADPTVAIAQAPSRKGHGAPSSPAPLTPAGNGLVLGSTSNANDPLLGSPLTSTLDGPASGAATNLAYFAPSRSSSLLQEKPKALSSGTRPLPSGRTLLPIDPLRGTFSNSDLLGGTLTLGELGAPSIPAMARAERARWARSGDPLAPLPSPWREPMRQAIQNLPSPSPERPKLEAARVVHVPSTRVSRPTDVPLAIQSDGSVDILSSPDDPAVVEEIRSWSSHQTPPAAGSVTPAVVHLHPLEDVAPATPPASPTAALPAQPPTVSASAPVAEVVEPSTTAPAAGPPATGATETLP